MTEYLLGIDDTDDLGSRGTGHLARRLCAHLEAQGLARLLAVTRHQLLVSPDIPYTSHNSSACLRLVVPWCQGVPAGRHEDLAEAAAEFIRRESADGSDPGLCLVAAAATPPELLRWGACAKQEVLTQHGARTVASNCGVFLRGLGGDEQGIIGAMAAVGLHAQGNDGRVLWLPGLRELPEGELLACGTMRRMAAVDEVRTVDGLLIDDDDLVRVAKWMRPVWRGGCSVLLVDNHSAGGERDGGHIWDVLARDEVKRLSN